MIRCIASLLVASPLYIGMGTPPALSDSVGYAEHLTRIRGLALTTKLVDTVYIAGFIVFITGLRELVRSRDAEYEWVARAELEKDGASG